MKMKVLIAGYGYLGGYLGEHFAKLGHEVSGIRRNWQTRPSAIQALTADLLEKKTLANLPQVDAVIFCQAPSKESDSYENTYFKATQNLLASLDKKIVKKIIFISSTSVYGKKDGSWVDESTVPETDDKETDWLLRAEQLVLKSGCPSVVLRLAGIYGPGRNRLKALKEGRLLPTFTEAHTNRIYVRDVVQAVGLSLEKGTTGEVYVVADDAPCTQKEFYTWLCKKLNLPHESDAQPTTENCHYRSNKRCRNTKIKALGLKLQYPSYKQGYLELINS